MDANVYKHSRFDTCVGHFLANLLCYKLTQLLIYFVWYLTGVSFTMAHPGLCSSWMNHLIHV